MLNTHWAQDGGVHAALNYETGDGVAASITDLLNAVEMLLMNKDAVDRSFLPLRAEDHDPDNDFPRKSAPSASLLTLPPGFNPV